MSKKLYISLVFGSLVVFKTLSLNHRIYILHTKFVKTYRLNQKNWKPTFIPFAKARKRIETLFSQLTDQFLVIRNYAKITNGLFARIIGKITALTILQYVNFIDLLSIPHTLIGCLYGIFRPRYPCLN